jgi:cystathionine beta-synthase
MASVAVSRATEMLSLIGNTPVVELRGFSTGPCRLFVKLETQNPGGSIKDRIALSMIDAAEEEGILAPGDTIVEATSGNTGLGLAMVAAIKGYRLIIVIPDKMSAEKVCHLRAAGADVRITQTDVPPDHPQYYENLAASIAEQIGAYHINQFHNEANVQAHERSTGPEIWQQLGHDVDAVVCGIGSGGTLSGLSRFFSRVKPDLELVLADPEGSALATLVETGQLGPSRCYAVEGIGQPYLPPIADLSRVRKAFTISDVESFQTSRDLLRNAGIFAGASSGTLVAAALRYCREQVRPKRVVTFICDSGNKYLSTFFNNRWLCNQGFAPKPRTGTLEDVLIRKYGEGDVMTVCPDDSLRTAVQRMRTAHISRLPVMENGRLVGILDDSDLMDALCNEANVCRPVWTVMRAAFETVSAQAPVSDVFPILDRGPVALVTYDGRFQGLITRMDLLNYLYRTCDTEHGELLAKRPRWVTGA